MELQTSGIFYNGENNSKSIKIIVEEGLRDKEIFLDFETDELVEENESNNQPTY